MRVALYEGAEIILFSHSSIYTGATPDVEYELRFGANEEWELIDRIDEMSLRGMKLCVRCTEKHPGTSCSPPSGSAG